MPPVSSIDRFAVFFKDEGCPKGSDPDEVADAETYMVEIVDNDGKGYGLIAPSESVTTCGSSVTTR